MVNTGYHTDDITVQLSVEGSISDESYSGGCGIPMMGFSDQPDRDEFILQQQLK